MKEFIDKIKMLTKHFSEKEAKKLQLSQLLRVLTTLDTLNVNDEEIRNAIVKLMTELESTLNGHLSNDKIYKKQYYQLKQLIQKKYGIVEKGTYTNMGISIGMTIGMSMGIVVGLVFLSSLSPALVIGMMFGMGVGGVVGYIREKIVNDIGKAY